MMKNGVLVPRAVVLDLIKQAMLKNLGRYACERYRTCEAFQGTTIIRTTY